MRDLAILTFVTLDGVMQAPSSPDEDRSGGFQRGGWAYPYWSDVMEQVEQYAMSEPYDMLFGRATYQMFSEHWSRIDNDPTAEKMNGARKYVVSSQPIEPSWSNSHLINGDVLTLIKDLKSQPGPLIQVHGSCQLIQTLLANDLIDEFRIWTFPVLVGSGKRLFETGGQTKVLRSVEHRAGHNGVIMSIYRSD